jgi:hypothetical protein
VIPTHDIVRGESVSQIVRPEIGNPCPFDCCIEGGLNIGDVTILVTKDVFGPYRLTFPDGFKTFCQVSIYRNLSCLVGFGFLEIDKLPSDLVPPQGKYLTLSHAGVNGNDDKIPKIDSLRSSKR